MRTAAIICGLALSLAASAALACPQADRCGGDRFGPQAAYPDRYDEGAYYEDEAYDSGYADEAPDGYDPEPYGRLPAVWADDRGLYIHGHRGSGCACGPPPPPCNCPGGLTLGSSFFDDAGGVGPIPDGGYYGGGYYIVSGGASSRAFASASARSSSSISIRYHGGRHGGHRRHGGHKH